mmetsp:Transcript_4192/g.13125  ORF Transcript_4192/g.13125 Transcript_4192/m.13125 type:complete len:210 (+) Transcript_4192:1123-1752(+)
MQSLLLSQKVRWRWKSSLLSGPRMFFLEPSGSPAARPVRTRPLVRPQVWKARSSSNSGVTGQSSAARFVSARSHLSRLSVRYSMRMSAPRLSTSYKRMPGAWPSSSGGSHQASLPSTTSWPRYSSSSSPRMMPQLRNEAKDSAGACSSPSIGRNIWMTQKPFSLIFSPTMEAKRLCAVGPQGHATSKPPGSSGSSGRNSERPSSGTKAW